MPRVFTAKAAKDYPDHGIVKGQTYYHWSTFRGPKQMSATRPRPSQVTGNDKLSTLYAAGEAFEDAEKEFTCPDDFAQALREYAEAVGEVVDMYRESVSNMEEAFQGGSPTIDEFNDNADNLEAFVEELEGAADSIEALDHTDYVDQDELRQRAESLLYEEFDGEGEYTPNDDDIDAKFDELLAAITGWDDLNACEKGAMLDEAHDLATSPSCPL